MNLRQLYNVFASHPEGQWIMQWPNAAELYEFVRKGPAKRVLGLGTGIGLSDAVVALAMKDKGARYYRIDSFEQYDKCIRLANQIIPAELKGRISFVKAAAKAELLEGIPYQYFSVYDAPEFRLEPGKGKPSIAYDLVINDGPAPFMEGDKYVDLPNGTVHKLVIEDKLKPGTTVIYDGRVQSLNLLERYFGDNFMLAKVPNRGDFTVLERKANPPALRDDKLEAMRERTNYFHGQDPVPGDEPGAPGEAAPAP